MFIYKAWMRTLATWSSFPFFVYGMFLIFSGAVSAWWLLASLVVYEFSMQSMSSGNHRLFAHKMYEASRFWHWLFAIWWTAFNNGSSVQWVNLHLVHHKYSDTEDDPHENSFHYFFRLKPKVMLHTVPAVKWMMKKPEHYYTHKYAVIIAVAATLLAASVSLNFFIFCYALPMFYHHITSGLMYVFSHDKTGALDRWYLEYIFPGCGEWIHKNHHTQDGARQLKNRYKWYHLDSGFWFAKLIRKTK